MNMRREERLPARIGTLVTFINSDGDVYVQRGSTVDVSDQGGCLEGLRFIPEVGAIVGVQNGQKRARFRVVWTGEPGSTREGQVGIERLDGTAEVRPILYIDDDPTASEERTTKLVALGYHVTRATNSTDAFLHMQSANFALIVAAYPLRDIDTSELLVSIRRSGARSKIILLSSYGRIPDSLVELIDASALKSDPFQHFITVVERALQEKKHIKFPTRSHRRYGVRVPVAIEVLRAGDKTMFYGTSVDLSERGIGAEMRAALVPGEMTKVYFSLPNSAVEIEAHALVRHRGETGTYGFEFVSINSQSIQTIKSLCAILPSIGAAKAAHR